MLPPEPGFADSFFPFHHEKHGELVVKINELGEHFPCEAQPQSDAMRCHSIIMKFLVNKKSHIKDMSWSLQPLQSSERLPRALDQTVKNH